MSSNNHYLSMLLMFMRILLQRGKADDAQHHGGWGGDSDLNPLTSRKDIKSLRLAIPQNCTVNSFCLQKSQNSWGSCPGSIRIPGIPSVEEPPLTEATVDQDAAESTSTKTSAGPGLEHCTSLPYHVPVPPSHDLRMRQTLT